ncbi:hypothetical protein R1flu_011977 [Riccia fluitans]|uniref:Uncharacterized protein n=1 Tax=Riccia fluitans TaxID=41844 RepID=A0ABD1ZA83_9MARC
MFPAERTPSRSRQRVDPRVGVYGGPRMAVGTWLQYCRALRQFLERLLVDERTSLGVLFGGSEGYGYSAKAVWSGRYRARMVGFCEVTGMAMRPEEYLRDDSRVHLGKRGQRIRFLTIPQFDGRGRDIPLPLVGGACTG